MELRRRELEKVMLDYARIFKIDFCTPKVNNKKDGFRKR